MFFRLSPIFTLTIIFQAYTLTGISYQNIVLGGITSLVPVTVGVVQGTKIATLETF